MKTFYLDMDGVVADFDAAAHNFLGHGKINLDSHRWPKEEWEKIRLEKNWFRTLPLTPWANELADLARQFRDEHGYQLLFLTAIPKDNDFFWAFHDKFIWAQTHFPDIPVHFGPYSVDKKDHCQSGDILVDDRLDNCDSWRNAGGIAVQLRYKSADVALAEVRQLLANEKIKSN
jgi:hypothetical protein